MNGTQMNADFQDNYFLFFPVKYFFSYLRVSAFIRVLLFFGGFGAAAQGLLVH